MLNCSVLKIDNMIKLVTHVHPQLFQLVPHHNENKLQTMNSQYISFQNRTNLNPTFSFSSHPDGTHRVHNNVIKVHFARTTTARSSDEPSQALLFLGGVDAHSRGQSAVFQEQLQ